MYWSSFSFRTTQQHDTVTATTLVKSTCCQNLLPCCMRQREFFHSDRHIGAQYPTRIQRRRSELVQEVVVAVEIASEIVEVEVEKKIWLQRNVVIDVNVKTSKLHQYSLVDVR